MTPTADLVLTLDIGTSSVRALLFDRNALHLDGSEARRVHTVMTTPDGGAELDPAALLREVEEVVDEILSKAGPRVHQIRADAQHSTDDKCRDEPLDNADGCMNEKHGDGH